MRLIKLAASVAVASLVGGCSNGTAFDHADAAADSAVAQDAANDRATDAGLADGGGEAGNSSLCGASSFLFCDGFEHSGGLLNWSQTYASGGIPTADTTHVYRGSYALHAHIDAIAGPDASAYAQVQQVQAWPAHVFVRYFAYQPSPHPTSPSGLVDLLQAASPYPGLEMLTDPPSGGLAMKTYSTAHDQAWASDGGVMTPDQWVCIELEVDTGAGTSHLYMNDVEVADLAGSNLALPQLGILGVGLNFFQSSAQGAQDAWIDEVAVNGTRIGCAN